MIIFLYGPDTYRSGEKLKEIIRGYRDKHPSGLNFRQLEWGFGILNEIKDILSTLSMFDEKKLIIVRGFCLSKKEEQDNLVELLENKEVAKDVDIIIVFFEMGHPGGGLFAWLKKKSKMAEDFDYLAGVRLQNWVRKKIQDLGNSISAGAVEKLIGFVGSDLWQMGSEIEKLINYKNGKQITESDVDLLVKSNYDPNIFATIDALAARNKNLAYKLMHQHLAQGENELYILTMFIYQFRNLLQIKSLVEEGISSTDLAKKTGLHPFVIKKSWAMLKNFSLDVLKKIYERLLNFDIAIKRGKIEPETVLDLIVAEIAG